MWTNSAFLTCSEGQSPYCAHLRKCRRNLLAAALFQSDFLGPIRSGRHLPGAFDGPCLPVSLKLAISSALGCSGISSVLRLRIPSIAAVWARTYRYNQPRSEKNRNTCGGFITHSEAGIRPVALTAPPTSLSCRWILWRLSASRL